jgi:archaellum biogenesis ATPase FlaH
MKELPQTILNNLVNNEIFCRKVIPHLKPSYFEGECRIVYKLFLQFLGKYNKLPNSSVLEIEFGDSDYVQHKDANEVLKLIRSFKNHEEVENDWLVDSTEKWCKERAIYLAIFNSIDIIEGKDKKNSEGAIPDLLSKALSVSFDTNVGHDYIENCDLRFEHYHKVEDKFKFDLEMFNKITNNGVTRKSLNIVLAPTGVGKSLFMCHMSAAALTEGKNVLYITMEMSEEKIAERIDANLFDVDIQDIQHLNKAKFDSKMKKIKDKGHGRLIIKEYPTAMAHTGHFRALLNELKMKKKFLPDVIFIDYLNICASSRMKTIGGSIGSYNLVKAIAEEVRGLAVEFNIPIWSATQVNREGMASSDIDLTNTSESIGITHTADLMFAILTNENLEKAGQLMVKQLKNRYNDPTKNKRFCIGVDRAKMRLYDLEEDAQKGITDSGNTSAEFTPKSIGNLNDAFEDLKV